MGSVRKRGKRWNAQVRVAGWNSFTKTFSSKSDALDWITQLEEKLRSHLKPDAPVCNNMRLGDLLLRYCLEVSPSHKGHIPEKYRLEKIAASWIGDLDIRYLNKQQFIKYRDDRLINVKGGTVVAELRLIKRVIQIAIRQWGIGIPYNPLNDLQFPKGSTSRNRRLLPGELEKLLIHASSQKNPLIAPIIEFAIETAMRRSEILNLQWRDIDLQSGFAFLYNTKNRDDRRVPLTKYCRTVLQRLPNSNPFVFPISATCIHLAWNRAKKKSDITDLRFHDLRHEGISRFFEMGLSVPEVALISGHKDVRQLFRYTHLNPENIYKKYPAF